MRRISLLLIGLMYLIVPPTSAQSETLVLVKTLMDGTQQLVLLDLDSDELTPITESFPIIYQPIRLPNNTVRFMTIESPNAHLYTLDLTTGDLDHQATFSEFALWGVSFVKWSTEWVVVGSSTTGQLRLSVIGPHDEAWRSLLPEASMLDESEPLHFDFENQTLVFMTENGIYRVDLATNALETLYDGQADSFSWHHGLIVERDGGYYREGVPLFEYDRREWQSAFFLQWFGDIMLVSLYQAQTNRYRLVGVRDGQTLWESPADGSDLIFASNAEWVVVERTTEAGKALVRIMPDGSEELVLAPFDGSVSPIGIQGEWVWFKELPTNGDTLLIRIRLTDGQREVLDPMMPIEIMTPHSWVGEWLIYSDSGGWYRMNGDVAEPLTADGEKYWVVN